MRLSKSGLAGQPWANPLALVHLPIHLAVSEPELEAGVNVPEALDHGGGQARLRHLAEEGPPLNGGEHLATSNLTSQSGRLQLNGIGKELSNPITEGPM